MKWSSSLFIMIGTLATLPLSHGKDLIELGRRGRTEQTYVKMRDGVPLHTRMVFPRNSTDNKYTVVIDRSPYGYTGLEWIADILVPFGFVAVGQDMRGTQKSAGHFTIWHEDANDGQDLGDWIVQQPWSDGSIYTFGASADGMASFTIPYNHPEWLKNQYVIWSSANGYEVMFPNGCYLQSLIETWMQGTVREDDYAPCMQEIWANEAKTSWWDPVEMQGKFDMVKTPSGFWSGWYDFFLVGNLASYYGYNFQSAPEARLKSSLVIDPLGHCQNGAAFFPQSLIDGRSAIAVAQMLQTYGIRDIVRPLSNVTFYVMSSNDTSGLQAGNFWTSLEQFPAFTPIQIFLAPKNSATFGPPSSNEEDGEGGGYTTISYDPANPVPTVGGSNLNLPCGPLDQKEVDERADVMTFNSQPFSSAQLQGEDVDGAFYCTGPLGATLYVSSDVIDTDFTAKISDVYPTGEVRIIQDASFRMRWRLGGTVPTSMENGTIYKIDVNLWNTSYVFAPGHSLRVSISSSNYPRFSANPNNGLLLSDPNYPGESIVAQNRLHHSAQYPSHVTLSRVTRADLPPADILENWKRLDLPESTKDFLRDRTNHFFENSAKLF
jgi:predicted acyl esterase